MIHRDTIQRIQDASRYAANKHGVDRTPLNPSMSDYEKLAILVEEVGEVGRLMTYDADLADSERKRELEKELAQIAAMCGMWMDSL